MPNHWPKLQLITLLSAAAKSKINIAHLIAKKEAIYIINISF